MIKVKDYKLSIIIAVYNNGSYLKDRCIYSIKESTMFNDIEILLIDDGSTDYKTIDIEKNLENQYDNIKLYNFPSGGSGNASRPRNYGLKLATSNIITYLDPDNEAINDGYYKLYNEIKDSDYDIVVGNYLIQSKRGNRVVDYYNVFSKIYKECSEIIDTKDFLLKNRFGAKSIQVMLIRTDLLLQNNIIMII